MNFNYLFVNVQKLIKSNTPEILTGLALGGLVSTAYLSVKATFEAARVIEKEQDRLDKEIKSHPLSFGEKTKLVWPLYITPGISGVLTLACITGSAKSYSRRTAAAVTAYSLSEKAFDEYREKAIEKLTEKKELAMRDEIAQETVDKNPYAPPANSSQVVIIGPGQVLCCELLSRRYFHSDMDALKKAENKVNHWLINSQYCTLDDFYSEVGLEPTEDSGKLGWSNEKLMEMEFTTVLAADGQPCLAFKYNYLQPLN